MQALQDHFDSGLEANPLSSDLITSRRQCRINLTRTTADRESRRFLHAKDPSKKELLRAEELMRPQINSPSTLSTTSEANPQRGWIYINQTGKTPTGGERGRALRSGLTLAAAEDGVDGLLAAEEAVDLGLHRGRRRRAVVVRVRRRR